MRNYTDYRLYSESVQSATFHPQLNITHDSLSKLQYNDSLVMCRSDNNAMIQVSRDRLAPIQPYIYTLNRLSKEVALARNISSYMSRYFTIKVTN